MIKGIGCKKKFNKYKFILLFHCIRIVTCNLNALFRSQLKANDLLSHVQIFDYLQYYYYYYFEIIQGVQFKCLDDVILDMWPNLNMPCGIFKKLI
jgi:hypothetical protein